MPYIDQPSRALYAPGIKAIVDRIPASPHHKGDLTYVITEILHKAIGENLRYSDYCDVIGILECAKLEFYVDRVHEYEKKKKAEHGDLYKNPA